MVEAETERFTVGVFQDIAWAHKGLDALKQAGFPVESLTILIKDGPMQQRSSNARSGTPPIALNWQVSV